MRKSVISIISIAILSLVSYAASAQDPEMKDIYGERKDTLKASSLVGRRSGNYLSKVNDIRTEVISAAGLCKMACCNLAESFENSASVTVGYSDAITGARQIRLLGQNGIYTQMLDENRPIMRGLSAPFGLNYVPGQWLESIQIAKGVTSVINGVESMTGQINLEHRKPTDEIPLFLQASVMQDTKCDLNVASAFQFDELSTWSTIIFAHVDANIKTMDMNGDGFMDDPRQFQVNIGNRWLYFGQDGVQVRFGFRGIQDSRIGGQGTDVTFRSSVLPTRENMRKDNNTYWVSSLTDDNSPWRAGILSRSGNAYAKVGVPLNEDGSRNIAFVADYTYQWMNSTYGNESRLPQLASIYYSKYATSKPNPICRTYDAGQHTLFANLIFQDHSIDSHHFTLGISETADFYDEEFCTVTPVNTVLSNTGIYGEYTFSAGDKFSAIVGLRGDYYNKGGFRFNPRLTLKYAPSDQWVFRANGGRGIRYSTPLVDNIGVFSTFKDFVGDYMTHPLEESWTYGANVTWYLPFDLSGKTYLSVDWFSTNFTEQMLVDYTDSQIFFYTQKSMGGKSYTNNLQVDFSSELFKGFTATLTGRFTDAHQTLVHQSDDVKPMTSKYKGVLNLQYATNLNKWIFDFTASINGPCRVWDFMKGYKDMYQDGYSPVYPLLYAQITRRFKGFDIYLGGENLTNYVQPSPIIGSENPFKSGFDASCVWGPIMGIRAYAGVRVTLWKKEK